MVHVFLVGLLGLAIATPIRGLAAEPLGLLQGYRLAIQNDHQLRAAQAQASGVQESIEQAQSRLGPQVNLSSSRYKLWQQRSDNGVQQPSQNYVSENDGLSLRQPIYQPRLRAGLEQARYSGEGAMADLADQRQALADRYTSAHVSLLLAQEQLVLLTRQRESTAVQLDAAKKAFAAGAGIRTDIDETQAQLDRLDASLLQARQAVKLASFELETLVGQAVLAGVTALSLQRFDPAKVNPGPLESWLERAMRESPRLKSRLARTQTAQVAAGAAKYDGYPTLDLIAQVTRSSSDDAYFVNSQSRSNAIGLSLTVPIYAGGAVSSRERQTAAELTAAQEQQEQARKQIELQIRQQLFAVTEGIEMIAALEQAKRSADQALLANVQSFRAGSRRSLDVLNAEQRQLQAALDLSKARYQTLLAYIRLHVVAGVANEDLMRQVNEWFAVGS